MTDGDFLSPESTVTSLFASSGRLRSTQHSESAQTIWYKDKTYESASEALDAYIADFQRSQLTSGQSNVTGQLTIPKAPVTCRLSRPGFKNKDGKRLLGKSHVCHHFMSTKDLNVLLRFSVIKVQCYRWYDSITIIIYFLCFLQF